MNVSAILDCRSKTCERSYFHPKTCKSRDCISVSPLYTLDNNYHYKLLIMNYSTSVLRSKLLSSVTTKNVGLAYLRNNAPRLLLDSELRLWTTHFGYNTAAVIVFLTVSFYQVDAARMPRNEHGYCHPQTSHSATFERTNVRRDVITHLQTCSILSSFLLVLPLPLFLSFSLSLLF